MATERIVQHVSHHDSRINFGFDIAITRNGNGFSIAAPTTSPGNSISDVFMNFTYPNLAGSSYPVTGTIYVYPPGATMASNSYVLGTVYVNVSADDSIGNYQYYDFNSIDDSIWYISDDKECEFVVEVRFSAPGYGMEVIEFVETEFLHFHFGKNGKIIKVYRNGQFVDGTIKVRKNGTFIEGTIPTSLT